MEKVILHPGIDAVEKTYISLQYLFEACREKQEMARTSFLYDDSKAWLNEWCTIRFSGTRRCGHSYAIIRLLSEYRMKSIIFYPNSRMMKCFDKVKEQYDCNDIIKIESINFLDYRGYDFSEVSAIAVECSFFVSNRLKGYLEDMILSSNIRSREFFLFYIQ